jgi:hypothetical protein
MRGAPSTCTESAVVRAIENWFRAVHTGDPKDVRQSIAADFRSVTLAPFGPSESLFKGRKEADLLAYIKTRSQKHEVLTLRSVKFNGWRLNSLQFGPIFYDRTADDLGPNPRHGFGKGAYQCAPGQKRGLIVLNAGPEDSN